MASRHSALFFGNIPFWRRSELRMGGLCSHAQNLLDVSPSENASLATGRRPGQQSEIRRWRPRSSIWILSSRASQPSPCITVSRGAP